MLLLQKLCRRFALLWDCGYNVSERVPVCVETLVKNPPPGIEHNTENLKVTLTITVSSSDLL